MPKRDKEIMEKLFELKILDTSEIAFVLSCSVQVVQKRKREYEKNGTITAVKEMSWQKIKPEHREVGHLPLDKSRRVTCSKVIGASQVRRRPWREQNPRAFLGLASGDDRP